MRPAAARHGLSRISQMVRGSLSKSDFGDFRPLFGGTPIFVGNGLPLSEVGTIRVRGSHKFRKFGKRNGSTGIY
jgi:hypothetical protein